MDESDPSGGMQRSAGADRKEIATIYSQIDDLYTVLNRKLDKADTFYEQDLLGRVREYTERRLLEEHKDLLRIVVMTADDLRYITYVAHRQE